MKICSRRERRAIAHDAGLGSPRGALHGEQVYIKCIWINAFNLNHLYFFRFSSKIWCEALSFSFFTSVAQRDNFQGLTLKYSHQLWSHF